MFIAFGLVCVCVFIIGFCLCVIGCSITDLLLRRRCGEFERAICGDVNGRLSFTRENAKPDDASEQDFQPVPERQLPTTDAGVIQLQDAERRAFFVCHALRLLQDYGLAFEFDWFHKISCG